MEDWMRRARRRHLLSRLPRYGVVICVWLAGVFRGGGLLFSAGAVVLIVLAFAIYGAALLLSRRSMDAGNRALRATSLLVSESAPTAAEAASADPRSPVAGVIELRGAEFVWFPLVRGHGRVQAPMTDIQSLEYVRQPGPVHFTDPGFLTVVLRDGREWRFMTRHFGHIESRVCDRLDRGQRSGR